jgi:S-adenosylmethionine synthetase
VPKLFTSESVSEGHPDKLADSLSDSILDALLAQDPESRVAVEVLATNGLIQVAGEVRSEAYVNISDIVRKRIIEAGYDDSVKSFDGHTCGVNVSISEQSPDIANGVDNSFEGREGTLDDKYDALGAGDQGLVFGGAVNENPVFLPTPIHLSHKLISRLENVRKHSVKVPGIGLDGSSLYPDAKSQVTIEYDDNGHPVRIDTIVISTQHAEHASLEWVREFVKASVIDPVLAEYNKTQKEQGYKELDISNIRYFINPTGRFVIGGPKGDAGLTGRKIIVDTYGGYFRHGGGAFSGKDATKVDRSAAYAARWVAKNLVAAGLAEKVEIQIAYAIGVARPVSVYVDTFGTGTLSDEKLQEAVGKVFDLRPGAIIDDLELRTVPTYALTSRGGHFGRDPKDGFTWERTNRIEELKEAVLEIS